MSVGISVRNSVGISSEMSFGYLFGKCQALVAFVVLPV